MAEGVDPPQPRKKSTEGRHYGQNQRGDHAKKTKKWREKMGTKELAGIIAANFNGYTLNSDAIKLATGELDESTKKTIAQHINAIRDKRISQTVADWAASEQGRKYDGYLGNIHPCVLDGFILVVILEKKLIFFS